MKKVFGKVVVFFKTPVFVGFFDSIDKKINRLFAKKYRLSKTKEECDDLIRQLGNSLLYVDRFDATLETLIKVREFVKGKESVDSEELLKMIASGIERIRFIDDQIQRKEK